MLRLLGGESIILHFVDEHFWSFLSQLFAGFIVFLVTKLESLALKTPNTLPKRADSFRRFGKHFQRRRTDRRP